MIIGVGVGTLYQQQRKRVVSDSFTRANSTTSAGTTDTGQAWSPLVGTWGIASNRVYCVSDANGDILSVDTGITNSTISAIFNCQTSGANQRFFNLMFHGLDATNFLFARISGSSLQLYKNAAGVLTQLAAVAITPPADGVDFVLRATCIDNLVSLYVDGALLLNHTLAGGDTAYSAYTKAGLRLSKAGTPTMPCRADNFTVVV